MIVKQKYLCALICKKKIELKLPNPEYCISALLLNAGSGYLKINRGL